jgi:hypothetical protein
MNYKILDDLVNERLELLADNTGFPLNEIKGHYANRLNNLTHVNDIK